MEATSRGCDEAGRDRVRRDPTPAPIFPNSTKVDSGVRPERDQHGEPADATAQRPAYHVEEERKWAGSRRIGDQDANTGTVDGQGYQVPSDESVDLLVADNLIRAADTGSRCSRSITVWLVGHGKSAATLCGGCAILAPLAPMVGFYPSVYVGAPWWFLDAPDAIGRFRVAVSETIGFTRTSGFVDDTRAFCSIPARHDMARRLDAGFLARLVAARQAAPIRLVHLELGNFFRAHRAWFTERAPDAEGWGYAACAGRASELAAALATQDGLYTLLERGPVCDTALTIASVAEAHVGVDHPAWLESVASPQVAAITMTVTEAGYCLRSDGGLDADRRDVTVDVGRLRADITAPVTTAPGRLVAGLAARRAADSGPMTLVPCDNVPGNGEMTRRVVADFAEQCEELAYFAK